MDPITGNPYPGNKIPSGSQCANSRDCINPVATRLLNGYLPQSLFVRWSWKHLNSQSLTDSFLGTVNNFLPPDSDLEHNNNLIVSHNYAITDRLVNEARFGLSYVAQSGPDVHAHAIQTGVYGQDEWRLNNRLTLTFGLRWQALPPFVSDLANLTAFDVRNAGIIVPSGNQPRAGFLETINTCVVGSGITFHDDQSGPVVLQYDQY